MNATQYRQSPDGGTRHMHSSRDKLLAGWTLHDGPIPGPDTTEAEIDVRLHEEMMADMANQQRWVDRRVEIEQEVRDAQR